MTVAVDKYPWLDGRNRFIVGISTLYVSLAALGFMIPSFEYPVVDSTQRRDLAPFVSLSLMGMGAFPAVGIALSYMPPLLIAAFRFDLAGVFLLGVCHYDHR